MIFHENRLPPDDSHEISSLFLSKIRKDVAKFVVCCSRDWHFKGYGMQIREYYLLGGRLQHARIQNIYQKGPTQVFCKLMKGERIHKIPLKVGYYQPAS